jgi:hypothetical protein
MNYAHGKATRSAPSRLRLVGGKHGDPPPLKRNGAEQPERKPKGTYRTKPASKRRCPACGEWKAQRRFWASARNPEGRYGGLKGGGRSYKTCGSCRAEKDHGRKRISESERDRQQQQSRVRARQQS